MGLGTGFGGEGIPRTLGGVVTVRMQRPKFHPQVREDLVDREVVVETLSHQEDEVVDRLRRFGGKEVCPDKPS